MKLIIDTDPGVDDAMAITFAALHPDIELLGLTTVFGNVTAMQGTHNALYLSERLGLSIPVSEGANVPRVLPPFKPSAHVHGPEGFGDLTVPQPKGKQSRKPRPSSSCGWRARTRARSSSARWVR